MTVSSDVVRIPRSVEQIDLAWFRQFMPMSLIGAQVDTVIHGTATKVKVRLSPIRGTEFFVWVKTGLEPHSTSIGNERVYAGESFFYKEFGGKYETRTPDCYFAETDDDGHSAIVLEDLDAHGAKFVEITDPATPDLIANGLEYIARYQAASWMDPELYQIDWLREGGAFSAANCLDWIYNPEHWNDYSKRPRFYAFPEPLRSRDKLEAAHRKLRNDHLCRAPWALSHGDAHYGQIYTLPNGEVRLIDWQCVQIAHYAQDPSNLITSGLAKEDRRRHERELLAHYADCLKGFGVENPPSADEAFDEFKRFLMHQVSWVMCLTEMQPEENCVAIADRAGAAAMDHNTVELLLAG